MGTALTIISGNSTQKTNENPIKNRLCHPLLTYLSNKMSSYSFYPGTPSFLAMKYLRTYTPSTNLMPGERYRLRRNMESKVPGYSEISRDLRCVSEEIEYARFKSPERDSPPPSWLRNSVVGYTTEK